MEYSSTYGMTEENLDNAVLALGGILQLKMTAIGKVHYSYFRGATILAPRMHLSYQGRNIGWLWRPLKGNNKLYIVIASADTHTHPSKLKENPRLF